MVLCENNVQCSFFFLFSFFCLFGTWTESDWLAGHWANKQLGSHSTFLTPGPVVLFPCSSDCLASAGSTHKASIHPRPPPAGTATLSGLTWRLRTGSECLFSPGRAHSEPAVDAPHIWTVKQTRADCVWVLELDGFTFLDPEIKVDSDPPESWRPPRLARPDGSGVTTSSGFVGSYETSLFFFQKSLLTSTKGFCSLWSCSCWLFPLKSADYS